MEIKIRHQENFIAKWNLCYFDKKHYYMFCLWYNYIVSDKTAEKKDRTEGKEVKTFQNGETLSMPP